jgi:hypothetical protein
LLRRCKRNIHSKDACKSTLVISAEPWPSQQSHAGNEKGDQAEHLIPFSKIQIDCDAGLVATTTVATAVATASATTAAVAAAATATAVAAAATTAVAAAAAATTATTTTAAAAWGARTCFVDRYVTTRNCGTIKIFNCFLCMLTISHFDKSETAGSAGFPIHDDVNRRYLSKLFECRTQIFVGGGKREVTYINIRHKTNPTNDHQ